MQGKIGFVSSIRGGWLKLFIYSVSINIDSQVRENWGKAKNQGEERKYIKLHFISQ